jgi:hypothetical protein
MVEFHYTVFQSASEDRQRPGTVCRLSGLRLFRLTRFCVTPLHPDRKSSSRTCLTLVRLKAKRRCIIHTRSRAGAKNGRSGVCVAHVHSCPLGHSGNRAFTSTHVHSRAIGQSRPLRRPPAPAPRPRRLRWGAGAGGRWSSGVHVHSCAIGQSGDHVHSCPLMSTRAIGRSPHSPPPVHFLGRCFGTVAGGAVGNVDVPRKVKTAAFDGRGNG